MSDEKKRLPIELHITCPLCGASVRASADDDAGIPEATAAVGTFDAAHQTHGVYMLDWRHPK